jgi:ribosomal protein L5
MGFQNAQAGFKITLTKGRMFQMLSGFIFIAFRSIERRE